MMDYSREIVNADFIEEMKPMTVDHLEEIPSFPDIKPGIDFALYAKMEELGVLRAYVARHEGKMVGYAIFIVADHPHYKGSLQATQDCIFLDKEHRRGWDGINLIRFCDDQLKDEGVDVVYQFTSKKPDFSLVLGRLGYEQNQSMWARRL